MTDEIDNYYDRPVDWSSGKPVASLAQDDDAENRVKVRLEKLWGVTLHKFSRYDPMDFWVEIDEKFVGIIEVKRRRINSDTHPTAWLNFRKWVPLTLLGFNANVDVLYVVAYDDAICWINLKDVDASFHKKGGTRQRVKSSTDIEPVIEIPISKMERIEYDENTGTA